jgi:hypothetical protein
VRYAIYWLPHYESLLYHAGQNWFEQTHRFSSIIEDIKPSLSYYDFFPALKIPQKYGFHSEILPPFSLKPFIKEGAVFDKCKAISKLVYACDVKMCLTNEGKSLFLRSCHKHHVLYKIREKLYATLLEIADFEPIINPQIQNLVYCQEEFQMTLSNTSDTLLQHDLEKIAQLYWQPLIKNPFEISHFNLCYQKNKNTPFHDLMRFDF